MPPPGPLVARIRLPLASSLSASRSVGPADAELGREVLLAAEEVARPEALSLDVVLDLGRDLLARAADRRVAPAARRRWPRAHGRPASRSARRPPAAPCPRSAAARRAPTGTTRTRRPSCWRITSWSVRAAAPLAELDLELDLVHAARLGVEGEPELARAARVAHGLLDRRRVHVHAADHDHVVGAADDAAGQPAVARGRRGSARRCSPRRRRCGSAAPGSRGGRAA